MLLPALRVHPGYFVYFGEYIKYDSFKCSSPYLPLWGCPELKAVFWAIHTKPICSKAVLAESVFNFSAGLYVFVGVFFLTAILLAIVVDSYW